MKTSVRTLLAAAAITATVAGCGGSSGVDTLAPADAVRAAVSTTTHQQSSRLAMNVSTDAGPIKVDIKADGLFDFAKKVGTMSMTVPGSMQKLDMVLSGDTMYMK